MGYGRPPVRFLLLSLVPVTAGLALAGCQSCVSDSSQPEQTQAHPYNDNPNGSGIVKVRPRLTSPLTRMIIRDSGVGDE
jgi:hypothetical protein